VSTRRMTAGRAVAAEGRNGVSIDDVSAGRRRSQRSSRTCSCVHFVSSRRQMQIRREEIDDGLVKPTLNRRMGVRRQPPPPDRSLPNISHNATDAVFTSDAG
jgi:hypothetical protein